MRRSQARRSRRQRSGARRQGRRAHRPERPPDRPIATIGTRIAELGLDQRRHHREDRRRSGWSRHSSRRPSSRNTTPNESTWPQTTVSNHETGLTTTISRPEQRRPLARPPSSRDHRPDEAADRDVREDRRDLDQVADAAGRLPSPGRPATGRTGSRACSRGRSPAVVEAVQAVSARFSAHAWNESRSNLRPVPGRRMR